MADDFTGDSTATELTVGFRAQAGAKSDRLDVTAGPWAQAGAKSTRTDVTATRGGFGSNTWSKASTALAVTETPADVGVVDLTGALAAAVALAAEAVDVDDPKAFAARVRGVGAAIRRNSGDRVAAGALTADGWIGCPLDIYRTGEVHDVTEGVVGFCVNGVDYLVWPYEALVVDDLAVHPGIRVGGS